MPRPTRTPNVIAGQVSWQCSRCRAWKPACDYFPDKRTESGLRSMCKKCYGADCAKRPRAKRACCEACGLVRVLTDGFCWACDGDDISEEELERIIAEQLPTMPGEPGPTAFIPVIRLDRRLNRHYV